MEDSPLDERAQQWATIPTSSFNWSKGRAAASDGGIIRERAAGISLYLPLVAALVLRIRRTAPRFVAVSFVLTCALYLLSYRGLPSSFQLLTDRVILGYPFRPQSGDPANIITLKPGKRADHEIRLAAEPERMVGFASYWVPKGPSPPRTRRHSIAGFTWWQDYQRGPDCGFAATPVLRTKYATSNLVVVLVWIPCWLPLVPLIPLGAVAFFRARSCGARNNKCVTCGYDLTGLTEPRCPECSTPYSQEF
jgi:hypothetical protein